RPFSFKGPLTQRVDGIACSLIGYLTPSNLSSRLSTSAQSTWPLSFTCSRRRERKGSRDGACDPLENAAFNGANFTACCDRAEGLKPVSANQLCVTGKSGGECPLWVRSRHLRASSNVRFTPESGHSSAQSGCPLCAKSGHQSDG